MLNKINFNLFIVLKKYINFGFMSILLSLIIVDSYSDVFSDIGGHFSVFTKAFIFLKAINIYLKSKYVSYLNLCLGVTNIYFIYNPTIITPSSIDTTTFFIITSLINLNPKFKNHLLFINWFIFLKAVLGFILSNPILYSQYSENKDISVNILTCLSMFFLNLKYTFFVKKDVVKICSWSKQINHNGKWINFEEFINKKFHTSHGMSEEAKDKLLKTFKKNE